MANTFYMTIEERFWPKVDKNGPLHSVLCTRCWIWKGSRLPSGYGKMRIGGRAGRDVGAHRISWEIHNGESISDNLCALHKCDNRWCVNPDHIYIGTHGDNMYDREKRNPGTSGRINKFSIAEIRNMKGMYKSGISQVDIATKFNTTQPYVSTLINDTRGTNAD